MENLAAFAEEIVVGYLKTPEGQDQAQKCLKKVLDSAIDSAMGYDSAFRKQVDAAIAKALQLHENIEIESYNDAIIKVMTVQLEGATADAIERGVAEQMKKLLVPVPAEIKLSELVEKYREYLKDQHDSGCVCHGESRMTFGCDDSDSAGFIHFWLDDEPNKQQQKCDIRFGLYKGKMYHLAFQSGDVERRLFVGPFYGFHCLLFQMKAANATVVVDCTPDDVELEYASHD